MARSRRPVVPTLWGALAEISHLRNQIGDVGPGMTPEATGAFLARLDSLEAEAILLIDDAESGQGVGAH